MQKREHSWEPASRTPEWEVLEGRKARQKATEGSLQDRRGLFGWLSSCESVRDCERTPWVSSISLPSFRRASACGAPAPPAGPPPPSRRKLFGQRGALTRWLDGKGRWGKRDLPEAFSYILEARGGRGAREESEESEESQGVRRSWFWGGASPAVSCIRLLPFSGLSDSLSQNEVKGGEKRRGENPAATEPVAPLSSRATS